jgi:hypothetical protein
MLYRTKFVAQYLAQFLNNVLNRNHFSNYGEETRVLNGKRLSKIHLFHALLAITAQSSLNDVLWLIPW